MSEWWTYRLSDFLLFSPRTYIRLFELYNRELWPLHLLALAAGFAILLMRRRGRVVAAILAVGWLWVAWMFLLKHYSTIQWAAKWFAIGFAVESLLLLWTGLIRNRFQASHSAGIALFVFALIVEPLLPLLEGRSWASLEVFGMTPDPTAVATLGIAVFSDRASLSIVPLIWCLISGATLWTLHDRFALLPPLAGVIAVAMMLWYRVAEKRVTLT